MLTASGKLIVKRDYWCHTKSRNHNFSWAGENDYIGPIRPHLVHFARSSYPQELFAQSGDILGISFSGDKEKFIIRLRVHHLWLRLYFSEMKKKNNKKTKIYPDAPMT